MIFKLVVRAGRPAAIEFSERISEKIRSRGGELVTDHDSPPDVLLAVGGDGTMLGAVRNAIAWDVPVLGFNLGTLGFLASVEPDEMEMVVDRLVGGDYEVDERTTVEASIDGVSEVGINDVVVEKVDSTRLVSLDVVIDGAPFVTYRADGLIVATPTGSTAYSFSAGGPLTDPRVPALVMTPVAAHSLFDRPMVLPETSTVEVTVSSDRAVKVNVDKSDLGELGEGQAVRIRRGDRPAKFIIFEQRDFASVVKDKFELT